MRRLKSPVLVSGLILTAYGLWAMWPTAIYVDPQALREPSWDAYAPMRFSILDSLSLAGGLLLIAVHLARRWRVGRG
jgi:hypothetical protein